MTSSNKARRYLQHHKQHYTESHNNHQSSAELLIIDPTSAVTGMRKFRGRGQQQQQHSSTPISIPQICVDYDDIDDNHKSNDDDNGHVAILDEFDEVLENELKRTSVLRTSSLNQTDLPTPMSMPVTQQRSFSFALGSSTNLEGDDDQAMNISAVLPKSPKVPGALKASLSKETFSRLLHSLAFRSGGNHTTSKLTMTASRTDSLTHPCLACQNQSHLDLLPKYKKRPSIFGVFVSKLNNNATATNENPPHRCPVCKRHLPRSTFFNSTGNHPSDDDNRDVSPSTQTFSSASLTSSKRHHEHGHILLRTKRRRSLPSLFHSLFDFDHHDKRHLDSTHPEQRPSFSSIFTHTLFDSITREQQQQQQQAIPIIKQTSPISHSSLSLAGSDDSQENHQEKSLKPSLITYDDSSQLTEKFQVRLDADGEKDEYDNGVALEKGDFNDWNTMTSNDSTSDTHPNQLFLHPPDIALSKYLMYDPLALAANCQELTNDVRLQREKTRNLLVNVFRTRRSNAALGPTETNMVGKQLSISVSNLTTSVSANRTGSSVPVNHDSTLLNLLDQRKHALSEENLPITDGTYIYLTNINGHTFKERLKYSSLSENTTLREILSIIFEKYHLTIDTCHICLRNTPTLPLSLDQPVKHLLLDDLIVTEKEHGLVPGSRLNNRLVAKSSAGKERNDKRNSTGSALLSTTSKSASATSKRLSTQCMLSDNDDSTSATISNTNINSDFKQITTTAHQQPRATKTTRSSLFTGSIFTRDGNDSNERPESNLAFVRRKCDEWLSHGLPKLAQLQNYQLQIDERDLKIDREWQPFLNEQAKILMSESIKLQQEAIYEMLSTEVSYVRQILTMTDIFMASVMILKSSQRDGLLNDIDIEKLFSNIQHVLNANLLFWKEILLPIKLKLEQTGCAMNPSDLKHGFLKFDIYFKSYLHYVLDQKASAEYFKQKLAKDDLFQYLIAWIEANFTNRLSFPDLTIKPLQRLTQYKLLLEAIQKRTHDHQQRHDLQEMIQKIATFVNRVNTKLHSQEQEERVRQISDRIGPFENVSAPPEITSILQEYYRDSISHRLDLLRDMPLFVRGYRRQIIQQGPMKMKDAKNSQDVYCYLFTDIFLITKGGKRSGTANPSSLTSSSSTSVNHDSQFNRGTPASVNKILKSPIRIDRMDVREYDRRGGGGSGGGSSNEPNTASFVAIVFSEYNLIECGYLFQTNLSKQWIENIRSTKTNFQLLMEESKMKLQNAHNHHHTATTTTTPPTPSTSNPIASIVHQSLPSLSSTSETSLDSPSLKADITSIDSSSTEESRVPIPVESIRRSSKVESDVFRVVEQTRRNSRSDHKNYGRYYTADGTGTHGTTPCSSSSSINPSSMKSTPSTAIIKRMSWNNEPTNKNDSTGIPTNELSNTNSFRSVHSSSGVSSTGSFLFSADEESSITTTTSSSIPALLPSSTVTKSDDLTDELDELDGKSSSSTVVGADDHDHLPHTLSSQEQHTASLINSNDIIDDINSQHLVSRLSSSSTNTLTSSNHQPIAETNTQLSSPETLLRRTPYASVKKRNQAHTHHRSGLGHQSPSHSPFRRHRLFDENDLRSSTHTVVYDSSKVSSHTSPAIPIRRTMASSFDDNNNNTTVMSSFGGSGNESDYDNNQGVNDYSSISRYLSSTARFMPSPVKNFNSSNELTRTDDLLLGDQNEIILTNHSLTKNDQETEDNDQNNEDEDDEHTEARVDLSDDDDDLDTDENTIQATVLYNNTTRKTNPQSDTNSISSTNSLQPLANHRTNSPASMKPTTIDDSTPSTYMAFRKDPLTTRKLLDIRSHLLLNTTLDATEV